MKKLWFISVLACVCWFVAGCGSSPAFTTGRSIHEDPAVAARQAAEQAIKSLGERPLKGMIFTVYYPRKGFTAPNGTTQYLPDPQAEQAAAKAIAALCKNVPNIGCRGRGLVRGGSLADGGVAVLAIGGDQVRCRAAMIPISDDRGKMGRRLAADMESVPRLAMIYMMSEMRLSFEQKPNLQPEKFLDQLVANCPRQTVLLGGNSMNNPGVKGEKALSGRQFFNGRAVAGHVVAMGVGGPLKVYVEQSHEFVPAPKAVTVTKVQGKWVIELDHKPAAGVYRKLRGMKRTDAFTSDWKHPIGILISPGKTQLRMILNWIGIDGKDKDGKPLPLPPGSLRFAEAVPVGSPIQILCGGDDAQAVLDSARSCVADSLAAAKADHATPKLVLVSDCCARAMRLAALGEKDENIVKDGVLPALSNADKKEQKEGETKGKAKKIEPIPVFGFSAFGQIGPAPGKPGKKTYRFLQHTFISAVLGYK